MKLALKERPHVIAVAGSNGAGKSTFYETQLKPLGLLYVNADDLARQLNIGPYEAAAAADRIRRVLAEQRRSFIFETVFSDPVGDKVAFLDEMQRAGYQVILCFIWISTPDISQQRVDMRVSRGGHDVPPQKIAARHARTIANLKLAVDRLPDVRIFDNDDLAHPYRLVAHSLNGHLVEFAKPVPPELKWLLSHKPRK